MKNIETPRPRPDLTAHELHRAISADFTMTREVVRMAGEITEQADSLGKAFIILGINTIKKITRLISEKPLGNSDSEQ